MKRARILGFAVVAGGAWAHMQPCTRYIIAAKRTEGTQWVPEIYSEKIGECVKKFGSK